MVIVDYFSNFAELDEAESTETETIVKLLKRQFARHGIPAMLTSDNGPPFSGRAFRDFLTAWGIEHQPVSRRSGSRRSGSSRTKDNSSGAAASSERPTRRTGDTS